MKQLSEKKPNFMKKKKKYKWNINLRSTTRHQEGEGWAPIIRFNTSTFVCLSETKTWFSNATWRNIFYVQWLEVRGDCLFWWYWWYCWPSLFKLIFYGYTNITEEGLSVSNGNAILLLTWQLSWISRECMNKIIAFICKTMVTDEHKCTFENQIEGINEKLLQIQLFK